MSTKRRKVAVLKKIACFRKKQWVTKKLEANKDTVYLNFFNTYIY